MKKVLFIVLIFASFLWANSLSEIRNKGVIRVGVFENEPPFSKMVDGTFQGFEVDLAQELAKRIFAQKNGRVEFVGISSAERISFLQNNKLDLVVAELSVTKDRKKLIDFSTPYFSVDTAMMTRKEDHIASLSGLKDKNVLVEKGTIAIDRLKKRNMNLILCDSAPECYEMLKAKKGGAFCTDNTLLMAYTLIDSNMELGIKQFGRSDFIAIGVQKGNSELLKFINAQITNLSKEGFFKKAFEEQLNPFYKGTADRKYFLLDDLYNALGSM